MKLRALIVDDEAPARAELRYMLEKTSTVKVVGEAANAEEALELIKAVPYDVVFLDIQMPDLTGLDVANTLKDLPNPPEIVFVTAYSEHAVKAFELDATDYLVKPYDEERLASSIARLVKDHDEVTAAPSFEAVNIERIPVESEGKTILLATNDVVFINSRNDQVFIHTTNATYSTRFNLKELERRLQNKAFFRVHRGYLVNLHHVEEIVPMFGRTYILRVRCSRQNKIPVSRRRGPKLKALLGM